MPRRPPSERDTDPTRPGPRHVRDPLAHERDVARARSFLCHETHVDVALGRLAAVQHAMVSTRQLAALGLGRSAVLKRVRAGRLVPYLRSVYRVGPFLPAFGPEMAALLACPGAVLAFLSAAFVLQLAPRPREVHVISATNRRSREGLRVHRAQLAPEEIWDGQGLALTSPCRTLSDLRGEPGFDGMVWEASYRRLVTDEEARALLGRKVPKAAHGGERRLVDLIVQAGLPAPRPNVRVAGFEVDLFWPEHRLAVELDSQAAHGHALAVDRDRRKEAALRRLGIDLVRVGGAQLSERPLEVLTTIAVALAPAA